MDPLVTVRATGYVPLRRPGEDERAAARRVHGALLQATAYLVQPRGRNGIAETRELFEATAVGLCREAARAAIAAHQGRVVAFHRLVLSPHACLELESTADLQRWTRVVLDRVGGALGRQLVWVGAVHRNTGLAHVHLIVAGACRAGRPLEVRPYTLALLRTAGADSARMLARERGARRERLNRYLDGV